jgi:hypothetical protein
VIAEIAMRTFFEPPPDLARWCAGNRNAVAPALKPLASSLANPHNLA